ncbi:MAG: AAA family ATPase [Thermoplasmata archaeon]|nr:AAA family ATPase [Thermoplasmata archaeon]
MGDPPAHATHIDADILPVGKLVAARPLSPVQPLTSASTPFVGREREFSALLQAVQEARKGRGTCVVLSGLGGMGKTRLLRSVQHRAEEEGTRVLWGHCLRESHAPFFPFEQIMVRLTQGGTVPEDGGPGEGSSANPSVLLLEEDRPRRLIARLLSSPGPGTPLLVTRDRPSQLKERHPELAEKTRMLWLSRVGEDGAYPPAQMDLLVSRLEAHLKSGREMVVGLSGLEYLVSQNNFLTVLRMVQFLRDVAESHEGHLLVSLNPAAFDQRQLSLLEAEGEVERTASPGGEDGHRTRPPSNPRERSGEAQATTLLRYLETLEREARRSPLFLIVDDLHWADPESLVAFHFLARNLQDLPLLLVGAMREEDADPPKDAPPSPLGEMLDHLEREGRVQRISLHGLREEEAGRLIEKALGAPLAAEGRPQLLASLLRRSGGNPYHVLELVHEMEDSGWIHRSGGHLTVQPVARGPPSASEPARSSEEPRPPEGLVEPPAPALPSLHELLGQRLDRLAPEDAELLDAAAVVGSEFDLEPLASALGRPQEELDRRAQGLAERSRLLIPVGEGRWAFGHPLVWEVAGGRATASRRGQRAAVLARWWAEHRPEDVGTIARLYHEAGDHPLADGWVRKALERAMQAQAGNLVEMYWDWLESGRSPTVENAQERLAELRPLAIRLLIQGVYPPVLRMIRKFLSTPLPDDLRIEAELGILDVNMFLAPAETLEGYAALGPELERTEEQLPTWVRGHLASTETVMLLAGEQLEGALARGREAMELLGEEGDPIQRSRTYINMSEALLGLRRWDEAQEVLASARTYAAAQELPIFLAASLNYEGRLFHLLGDLPAARKAYMDAVRILREIGSIPWVATYALSVAQVLLDMGDAREAGKWAQEALELAQRFDLPTPSCLGNFVQSEVLAAEGRLDESRAALEKARELAVRMGSKPFQNLIDLRRAELLGREGHPREALTLLDQLPEHLGEFEVGARPDVHRLRAHLLTLLGEREKARTELDRALEAALTVQNALAEARAKEQLSVWEDSYGDRAKGAELRAEANALLERCGAPPRSPEGPILSGGQVPI